MKLPMIEPLPHTDLAELTPEELQVVADVIESGRGYWKIQRLSREEVEKLYPAPPTV